MKTKEIENIVCAYDDACKQGIKTALATVVRLRGSSYHREGARVLVTEHGKMTGAIDGRIEGDGLRRIRMVIARQKAQLMTYDANDDDEARIGISLDLGGIADILVEPLNGSGITNPLCLLKKILAKRQNAVLATLFSVNGYSGYQPGTSLMLLQDGSIADSCGMNIPSLELQADAKRVLDKNESRIASYQGFTRNYLAYIEFIEPVATLATASS